MYMLDTCTFIWYILDDDSLSQSAKDAISGSNTVCISYATLWEITIKQTTGKLSILSMNVYELAELCRDNGIVILPLKLSYLSQLRKLSLIHRDPFDRLIIASAIEEDLTLLTNDGEMVKYQDVKTLW